MEIYVVKAGDSVSSIADAYGVSSDAVIYNNQLIYPYELALGQALLLPTNTKQTPKRSIAVSGYAYPFINSEVLEATLPYLTELPIFSYGFTEDGELTPPLANEDRMIELAKKYTVQPILTLTPFGNDGMFNNQLITRMINNSAYKEKLISNILNTMYEKGYQGLDIDFEYVLAGDRQAYAVFVKEVAEVMRANGFHTSVALAPKVSAQQGGILYEGQDYRALGEAADHLLLMTYEWGYTYGPPMAVAPLDQVRRVVEYALTEIPREKLDLGIPNYGYDWPLPYERGVTKARTLGNVEAVRLAVEQGATIQFDEAAQSPYFNYVDVSTGTAHEVWFEDVRSLQAKFNLIKEYELRGCGYWQIMEWFRANWILLGENFYVRK